MAERKLEPQLRFPGFEGEWEEKRLNDLFSEFRSGNGITSNDITESGQYPVYGGNGLRGYTNIFTHEGFYLLIGRQGALCGNINRSYGKAFISEHAIACQANESSDTEWLAHRLDYYNLNRLSESSAQPGLSVAKLLRLKLVVPVLKEQQKIASFLTTVDKRITLLTQKKEKLEQYKKGVMQKIFNREIRFKDENGNDFPEWEKKRLGDVGEVITGSTPETNNKEYYGGEFLFVSPIDIQGQRYIVNTKTKLTIKGFERVRQVRANSILFVCIGSTIGKIAQTKKKCVTNQQINSVIPFESYNDNFVYSLLEYSCAKIKLMSAEQAVPIVNKTVFSNFKLLIPILKEQQKIASFLFAIDQQIENVTKQIAGMKEWKKGLLQQLFV